ncbi:MAG TPA: PepSY domain-containing protein, partial [Casimicrobiaceae bacterium]|nr:PepSY domain-containing protein [Casimicrobiaceae bacterium]
KRGLIVGTLLVMATGTMAASAAPGNNERGTSVDFSKAPVTMSQAIATAEQQAGGRATRAKLENEKGKLLYEVKVAGKDKATEVQIDAQDGKVLATNAAQHEHKHGGRHEGEKQ